ncbi:MAG: hypothetical protein CMM01_06000 [Rhodopirellula sp.]|nr:hypothetical protein [Rhodopirellula sp.]
MTNRNQPLMTMGPYSINFSHASFPDPSLTVRMATPNPAAASGGPQNNRDLLLIINWLDARLSPTYVHCSRANANFGPTNIPAV